MHNQNLKNLATFIKVAIVAAVVITIVKTDIEAQWSFTQMSRQQSYNKTVEQGGGHERF